MTSRQTKETKLDKAVINGNIFGIDEYEIADITRAKLAYKVRGNEFVIVGIGGNVIKKTMTDIMRMAKKADCDLIVAETRNPAMAKIMKKWGFTPFSVSVMKVVE